ncbi:MAG: hypothetical protein WA323_15970 [Candidatus Nitrosopolaris sp.]
MVKRQNQFATTSDVITGFHYMALEPMNVNVDIPKTSSSEYRKGILQQKAKLSGIAAICTATLPSLN